MRLPWYDSLTAGVCSNHVIPARISAMVGIYGCVFAGAHVACLISCAPTWLGVSEQPHYQHHNRYKLHRDNCDEAPSDVGMVGKKFA